MPKHLLQVDCYADGCCINNGKPNSSGGWCYLVDMIGCERIVVHNVEPILSTTNNRMELMAVAQCLTCVTENVARISTSFPNEYMYSITITSDSEYVVNGITTHTKWWKRNGWKTKSGEEIRNKDMWLLIDKLSANINILWRRFPRNSCEQMCLVDSNAKKFAKWCI